MRTIHPQTIPSGKLTVCELENHHLQKVNQHSNGPNFQWTCEITRGYNHPDYQILSNYHKLSNTTWMNIILQILTNYQIINQLSTNYQILSTNYQPIIKLSTNYQILSTNYQPIIKLSTNYQILSTNYQPIIKLSTNYQILSTNYQILSNPPASSRFKSSSLP